MITQEEIPYTREEVKAMVKTIEQLRKEKKQMIEKACEWMKDYIGLCWLDLPFDMQNEEEFIARFKKAME